MTDPAPASVSMRSVARFRLGKVSATPRAMARLYPEEILTGLCRHESGDWGNLDDEDRLENELSFQTGLRLLSAYTAADGTRFWIITEADRSATSVLLPEDY